MKHEHIATDELQHRLEQALIWHKMAMADTEKERQRAEVAERERDGALASLGEAQQIVANLREAAVWQEAVSEKHRHQVYKVVEERNQVRAMAREVADVIESLQIETDMYRAVRLASCISRLRGEEGTPAALDKEYRP